MNLKQLEAFVQVAEGGSFSKAAKELFLTQPTISAHISSLEKELNSRLFVRNTKEVGLSEDGKDLYKYARQMVDLEKQIEERFETKEDGGRHCITIAASTIPAQYLLPKVLTRFSERYPEEQLKILETDSSQVVMQIVIVTPNTEKYQQIEAEGGEDLSWLAEEHFIMREEGSGTRKEAEKQLRRAGVNPDSLDVLASIENQETIKKSVRQGMGISVLSRWATKDEAAAGFIK